MFGPNDAGDAWKVRIQIIQIFENDFKHQLWYYQIASRWILDSEKQITQTRSRTRRTSMSHPKLLNSKLLDSNLFEFWNPNRFYLSGTLKVSLKKWIPKMNSKNESQKRWCSQRRSKKAIFQNRNSFFSSLKKSRLSGRWKNIIGFFSSSNKTLKQIQIDPIKLFAYRRSLAIFLVENAKQPEKNRSFMSLKLKLKTSRTHSLLLPSVSLTVRTHNRIHNRIHIIIQTDDKMNYRPDQTPLGLLSII